MHGEYRFLADRRWPGHRGVDRNQISRDRDIVGGIGLIRLDVGTYSRMLRFYSSLTFFDN